MRLNVLIVLLCFAAQGVAQADSSLTREFANLSAKERARIAKKEQEEAAKDVVFQDVMTDAERLFQARQYELALAQFSEARRLRPLNVYPKVKIQDLKALIAKQEAEAAVQDLVTPKQVEPSNLDSTVTRKEEPVILRREVNESQLHPAEVKSSKHPLAPSDTKFVPAVHQPPTPPIERPDPAPNMPDGITERSYLEGRAVVLERCVVANGRTEIFRRVSHPWGQVVHFRDGQAISDREWAEVFKGQ